MRRELFFEHTEDGCRVAILEDGVLSEVHAESTKDQKETESLFLGRIEQIRPSVGAAFVDIGLEQNGFLPLDADRPLRCGEMILVQAVAKQATASKGLRLTQKINLAGKVLVLVPGSEGVHLSKKIKDEALRQALQSAAEAICPAGCGLIVRTASQDVTREQLGEEVNALYERWKAVEQKAKGMARPGMLEQRPSLTQRMVRDWADRDLLRIVTTDLQEVEALKAMQSRHEIHEQTNIEFFEESKQLMFDAFSLESGMDRALKRRVWLPCGGYLVIDRCEAMTVVDVNSGKMILGRDVEETAVAVNLEAGREIAHQLRLRDIGGMVVIDFIDMTEESHRTAVIRALKEAVALDKAQVHVLGMTRLGLVELTRKRKYAELAKALRVPCSYCSGTGAVLGPQEVARRALMAVRRMALSGQRGPFVVRLAPAAADALAQCAAPRECDVYALAVAGRHAEKYQIEAVDIAAGPPREAVRLVKKDGKK